MKLTRPASVSGCTVLLCVLVRTQIDLVDRPHQVQAVFTLEVPFSSNRTYTTPVVCASQPASWKRCAVRGSLLGASSAYERPPFSSSSIIHLAVFIRIVS